MLNIAVIGAGVMGALHTRILSKLPNVKLIAVCDKSISAGKSLAHQYNTKYYRDYKKMIDKEALNAVIIAVPTSLHRKIALDCINNNLNLLVEKPLAATEKEAQSISKAAKNKKVVLSVGHIERYNPAVIKLKELLEQNYLGEVVSVVIKRVGLFPPRIKDVNVITDLAVHDLDIICYLLNNTPKKLFANGGNGQNLTQIDFADIFLDFGKTSCYIQVNWMTPVKIRTLSVTGTLGYCELDYINQSIKLFKSKFKSPSHVPSMSQFNDFVKTLGTVNLVPITVKKEEPLKLELINFLNAVSSKSNPRVSPAQGVLAVKLTELVLKSITQKKAVHFK